MEEIKKQILLINIANYNEKVNNISKFKLNDREINLFCDIMQQFAEKYHAEKLSMKGLMENKSKIRTYHFSDWVNGVLVDEMVMAENRDLAIDKMKIKYPNHNFIYICELS